MTHLKQTIGHKNLTRHWGLPPEYSIGLRDRFKGTNHLSYLRFNSQCSNKFGRSKKRWKNIEAQKEKTIKDFTRKPTTFDATARQLCKKNCENAILKQLRLTNSIGNFLQNILLFGHPASIELFINSVGRPTWSKSKLWWLKSGRIDAAIAQWIRLQFPSCHPGFESQAHHQHFINLYLIWVM